jgi:hypothetical protein
MLSEDLKPEAANAADFGYLRRRLAGAYFAYFLCGWGDGGMSSPLVNY